jgi:hypothetical protein
LHLSKFYDAKYLEVGDNLGEVSYAGRLGHHEACFNSVRQVFDPNTSNLDNNGRVKPGYLDAKAEHSVDFHKLINLVFCLN